MPLSITNETKNNVTISNEDKNDSAATWDDMAITWDSASGTWDAPGTPFTLPTKNSLTITNETKP